MQVFLTILSNNVLPLGVMVALGVVLYRAFRLDLRTLSKLNFYLFSPVFMLKMLMTTELTLSLVGQTLGFFAVFFVLLYGVTEAVVRLRGYRPSMRSAMRNSVLFYNSGNYGIPLGQLVFSGNPLALSIQILIMMMQSLIPNTYGVYSVNSHQKPFKETMRTILSLPVVYVIPIAFGMRWLGVRIPHALEIPVDYVSQGFIATALLTLGVQLGSMEWKLQVADVLTANALRLAAGPLLGFGVVELLGLHGIAAQSLVLSCAVPTSLSSVLLAVEFDNEPEFASQAVFASTVFSMFTVAVVIYLIHFLA